MCNLCKYQILKDKQNKKEVGVGSVCVVAVWAAGSLNKARYCTTCYEEQKKEGNTVPSSNLSTRHNRASIYIVHNVLKKRRSSISPIVQMYKKKGTTASNCFLVEQTDAQK